jgi:hypothetical protein
MVGCIGRKPQPSVKETEDAQDNGTQDEPYPVDAHGAAFFTRYFEAECGKGPAKGRYERSEFTQTGSEHCFLL